MTGTYEKNEMFSETTNGRPTGPAVFDLETIGPGGEGGFSAFVIETPSACNERRTRERTRAINGFANK